MPTCLQCGGVVAASTPRCPACGLDMPKMPLVLGDAETAAAMAPSASCGPPATSAVAPMGVRIAQAVVFVLVTAAVLGLIVKFFGL